MNKKGFVFIETIVTLTVLMAILLVMYTAFINLLDKQKVGAEHNKYSDVMSLFYYKEREKKYAKIRGESYPNKSMQTWAKTLGLDHYGSPTDKCNLIIMNCKQLHDRINVTTLPIDTMWTCSGASKELEKYAKQVPSCYDNKGNLVTSDNKYVIIGEFTSFTGVHTFAYIYAPNYLLY